MSKGRFRYFLSLLMLLTFVVGAALPVSAEGFKERAGTMAKVTNVRVGATGSRVRVVIDTAKKVEYKTMVLREPGRIIIDIKGAWLDPGISRETIIESRFASRVRVAQFDPDTVRVVIHSEVKKENFAVFGFAGEEIPYRVVMDLGKLGGADQYASEDEITQADPNRPDDGEGTDEGEKSDKPDTEPGTEPEEKTGQTSEGQPETPPEVKPDDGTDKKDDKKSGQKKLPGLKGKKIAIDPGHGGCDPGAIGPTGVTEKSVTLRISLEVKKLLEAAGAKVIMTRTTDVEVSPKKENASDVEELQARCDIANKAKADVFVCIHLDSFSSREARGTTGYYYTKGTANSRRLAGLIQGSVVRYLNTHSRGTKSCNFYVVRKTYMPATLVEIAFLSNPSEEKLLTSAAGIKKAAQGVADGIAEFFKK